MRERNKWIGFGVRGEALGRLGLGLALEFDVVDRGEKLMDEF